MSPGKAKLGCAVVMTVKNDAEAFERTVEALLRQTRQPEEIIVTVASSDDSTAEVAARFAQREKHIRTILVGDVTRSEGRNRGVQETQQEIIAFTDAGCIPDKDWLHHLLLPFRKDTVWLVSGLTVVQKTSSFAEAQGAFVLVPPSRIGVHPLPATRNMAVRRQKFKEFGGFSNQLNYAEDYEFARRLQAKGEDSTFVPEAVVAWEARDTPLEFFQMIRKLTVGDMLASTWRLGHLTMWLRYLALFSIGIGAAFVFHNPLLGCVILLIFYSAYLLLKLLRFRFSRPASSFWAILLQVLADMAVLLGTAEGLVRRSIKKSL